MRISDWSSDVCSSDLGAEEDRQQLGVRQHGGAALEQLLAGAFAGGPVADVHGGFLEERFRRRPPPTWACRKEGCMRFATAAGDGCIAACRAVRRSRAATPVRVSCGLVPAEGFLAMAAASDTLLGRSLLHCVCCGIAASQSAVIVRRLRDPGAPGPG